jgi:hypothetical protein
MDIYWNIFTLHGPMNVKFPNNTSKWQMEFNSAFKGLSEHVLQHRILLTNFTEQSSSKLSVSHQNFHTISGTG